jgi:hypothetical protein
MAIRYNKPVDLKQVEALAGVGLNEEQICHILGITTRTLLRRKKDNVEFVEALKRGRSRAAGIVSNKLFDMAREGNLGAIVWWEKTRRGFSDRVVQEIQGNGASPLQVQINQALTIVNDPEAAKLASQLVERMKVNPNANHIVERSVVPKLPVRVRKDGDEGQMGHDETPDSSE